MIDEIAREAAASMRAEGTKIAAALDVPDWLVGPMPQRSTSATPPSPARLLRSPSGGGGFDRRRRIGMLLAAAVLLAGGLVIVRSIFRHAWPAEIRPASTQPADTPDTDPGSTPPAASTSPTERTITPATVTGLSVDLSGTTTGLVIPPTVLPDGWYAVAAMPEDAFTGGGSVDAGWKTIAGKYSADRTTLDEVITVEVADGILEAATASEPETVAIRSTTGHLGPRDLYWAENGKNVAVTSSAATDLVAIANGLHTRADGGFDFGYLPPLFEQIAVTPQMDSFGAGFYTAYATAQTTYADGAVLSVQARAGSSRPAEVSLTTSAGYGPSGRALTYATEINGRRAIVLPSLTPTIIWDEDDGTQITIDYAPLEGNGTVDERSRAAIRLASTLRRANTSEWADLLGHLAANEARFESATYMADQVAPLHLTIVGPSRQFNQRHPAFLVSVQDEAGNDAGTCEFFHRQLVTCDTPQQQAERDPNRFDAAILTDGYVRVIAGSATTTAILSFKDTKVASTGGLAPLASSATPIGVAYLAIRGDPTTMCLSFEDPNSEPISMTTDANTDGAIPPCTPA